VGALLANELVVPAGATIELPLRFVPRRLVVRLVRPNGAAVRGERVLAQCGGATWPSMRILTPLVDEVLTLDPAPELPVAFRVWTDGSPWSQTVLMPADQVTAEVTVVLPDAPR
jgi:hypothetical protein